ncbi:MAG: cupin domain-containing protein, partial [Pseudomonadota bacterium]|nr:cupin domain-containing protein [Pseudomonadota bacterium]
MPTDLFDNLFARFSLDASLLHAGPLCGVTEESVVEGQGHLHVIQRGWVEVRHESLPVLHIREPSLLFYPRPLAHCFLTDEQSGAHFVCATVAFHSGHINPILLALPPMLVLPLAQMAGARATIDLLFAEASRQRYGQHSVMDRLFEVLLIQLLRKVVDQGMMSTGMLAGLAHPQLGKAIAAVHKAPADAWTLQSLAAIACMSRSRFSQVFRTTLGSTPGEYLCKWRLALAQERLLHDVPLKRVAAEVGYGS